MRSTDLLALPNINPDSSVAALLDYDEVEHSFYLVKIQVKFKSLLQSLSDGGNVAFQAALLYTSSRGDRRIRVHTLCLPITSRVSLVHQAADTFAITSMLAKMGAYRDF